MPTQLHARALLANNCSLSTKTLRYSSVWITSRNPRPEFTLWLSHRLRKSRPAHPKRLETNESIMWPLFTPFANVPRPDRSCTLYPCRRSIITMFECLHKSTNLLWVYLLMASVNPSPLQLSYSQLNLSFKSELASKHPP